MVKLKLDAPHQKQDFQSQNDSFENKSKEEILRPYFNTLIIGIVTAIFGLVAVVVVKSLFHNNGASVNTPKEYLQNPEDKNSLKDNSISQPKPIEKEQESSSKSNTELFDKEINIAVSQAMEYLINETFDPKLHSQIYYNLKRLFAIEDLSEFQNRQLRNCLTQMAIKQQLNTKPPVKPKPNEKAKKDEKKDDLPISSKKTIKVRHVVKDNETLFQLSKDYNTTIERIKELNPNKVKDDTIRYGDTLIIEKNQ